MANLTPDQRVTQIIKEARELITPEDRWVQKEFFGIRDLDRVVEVHWHDSRADCFCLDGALTVPFGNYVCRVFNLPNDGLPTAGELWNDPILQTVEAVVADSVRTVFPDRMRKRKPGKNSHVWDSETLMTFNDHPSTTHEDVLAVLDHALAKRSA